MLSVAVFATEPGRQLHPANSPASTLVGVIDAVHSGAAAAGVPLWRPAAGAATALHALCRLQTASADFTAVCMLESAELGARNDKLIKETQLVWIKYTRSRAECYTHDT